MGYSAGERMNPPSSLPAVADGEAPLALQVVMELYEHGTACGVDALRRSVGAAVELEDVLRFGRQLAALDALRHMPAVVEAVGKMAAGGNLKAVDKLLAIVGAGAQAASKVVSTVNQQVTAVISPQEVKALEEALLAMKYGNGGTGA